MPSILRASVHRHPAWHQIAGQMATARAVIELVSPGTTEATVAPGGADTAPAELAGAGIRIVRHELAPQLPFGTREFDFAVCHHAFQHLDDPDAACREIARIARAGVVIAPAVVGEAPAGQRPSRWIVVDGGDELVLLERTVWDGRHGNRARPAQTGALGGIAAEPEVRPPGSPAFDVVFPWSGALRCRVVRDFPGAS